MPFPFIPAGLLLAITVLGATLVAFGLALKSLDWSIDAVRRSALTGIVSGLRDWQGHPDGPDLPAPPTSPAPADFEDSAALGELEAVEPDAPRRGGAG
ncbi:MAG TPA: hypothetical protein VFO73_05255 [Candidatus Limnocylindrales bacterium]|nr:hypothetical protein [Candidatus Limnocylindrales bacterium]